MVAARGSPRGQRRRAEPLCAGNKYGSGAGPRSRRAGLRWEPGSSVPALEPPARRRGCARQRLPLQRGSARLSCGLGWWRPTRKAAGSGSPDAPMLLSCGFIKEALFWKGVRLLRAGEAEEQLRANPCCRSGFQVVCFTAAPEELGAGCEMPLEPVWFAAISKRSV